MYFYLILDLFYVLYTSFHHLCMMFTLLFQYHGVVYAFDEQISCATSTYKYGTYQDTMHSDLKPTVNLAPARAVSQPEPMVVRPFHLAIATPMRSKARRTMGMIVARARAIGGPGQREFDREAVRERDGRRRDGRRGLCIHSWPGRQIQNEKRTSHTRPSPTIRLRNRDSRMSKRVETGVSNA